MIDWKPDRARWRQVYDVVRGRIDSGVYAPGDKLPSILRLQDEFGIAVATAQKVLHQLRKDGLTHTEPGVGTFVKRDESSDGA